MLEIIPVLMCIHQVLCVCVCAWMDLRKFLLENVIHLSVEKRRSDCAHLRLNTATVDMSAFGEFSLFRSL